jgi:hypothetical protein
VKQWGVGLRVDDGRRRGLGGGPAYSSYEGWTSRQSVDVGAVGGDSGADGGDYRVGSKSMGSSDFSGTPRNGPKQLHGAVRGNSNREEISHLHSDNFKADRGKFDRGEPSYLHNDNYGAVRGKLVRGDTVDIHNEPGGQQGEKGGAVLEDLVEQLSSHQGDHADDHADNVGVFSTLHVSPGKATTNMKESGAHRGAHVGAVEADMHEVRVWVPQKSGSVISQLEPSLSTMQGGEVVDTQMVSSLSTTPGVNVVDTQMETSLSTMLGAKALDVSVRTWKRTARQGLGHAAPVGPVTTNSKKRKCNLNGQVGGSTRGGKRNKRVEAAEDAETQEMAVAESQPRHQL